MTYHDSRYTADEDQTSAVLQMFVGLLGHEILSLDVDGEDFIDLRARDLVQIAKVLDTRVALFRPLVNILPWPLS